jgi:hypothetical protein
MAIYAEIAADMTLHATILSKAGEFFQGLAIRLVREGNNAGSFILERYHFKEYDHIRQYNFHRVVGRVGHRTSR